MKFLYFALMCTLGTVAGPAEALSYLGSLPGAPDPGARGDVVIDFDHPLPAGITFAPGSTYDILTGLVPHRGYNPAGDDTAYLSVPGSGTSGSATLDFTGFTGGQISAFSFYWGSIDRANELTITTDQGSLTLFGSQIVSSGYGSATSARDNRRVFFALDAFEHLKSVHLVSPTAFEIDDLKLTVAAPVPDISTWILMVSGFGLAGCALRRRPRMAPMPV